MCVYVRYTHTHTHTHTHIPSYIYMRKCYSVIKKNEILPFAAVWMDIENIMLSKIRERQIICITYMWNLKNNTSESICKTETDS